MKAYCKMLLHVLCCVVQRLASLLLLFLCVGCRAPLPPASVHQLSATSAVTITNVRFPSPSIGGLLCYRAIVPGGQPRAEPGVRLPVLYLLPGANSGPDEIQENSDVVKLATAERLIVVIPEAENSYYTNAKHRTHARWEDAIAFDLPRNVEATFSVLPGHEHRGIAGISMGGYGAVKLALKHPELYGFAGSMSGALDITQRPASLHRLGQTWRIWTIFGLSHIARQDEDIFNLLDHSPNSESVKWFHSCGMRDPLYTINARFLREMHAHGIPLDGITTPGFHDWQTWNSTMPELFKAAGENLR